MKKIIALTALLSFSSAACYGPFNLTRKLHRWNGEVGGRWVNEGVFLGLAVLNVYTFAALGDVIIFNSVEFWTGKNPVNAGTLRLTKDGDRVVAVEAATGKLVGEARREGDAAVVTDASGKIIARVRPDDLPASTR